MARYNNGHTIISYMDREGFYHDLSACFKCEHMHAEAYGMVSCKRKYCKYSAEEVESLIQSEMTTQTPCKTELTTFEGNTQSNGGLIWKI